jgi:hypothetical protein
MEAQKYVHKSSVSSGNASSKTYCQSEAGWKQKKDDKSVLICVIVIFFPWKEKK